MTRLIAVAALFISSTAASGQQMYVDRTDVESGRVTVTAPAQAHSRIMYVYPATGCRLPYVPKFGGGCELHQGYYVPRPYLPGGSYSYFFYYRR